MMGMRQFWFLCGVLWAIGLSAQEADPPRTVIDSDSLEMQGSEERNFFYFRGNVHVTGNNLEILCDELTVVAARGGVEGAVGEIGAIEEIVAQGSVEISQAGRRALAGRAEVDPVEGTVTLSENPKIIDGKVDVEAYQIVFYKDERRVVSIPYPESSTGKPQRSRVTLGGFADDAFLQEESDVTVTDRLKGGSGERTSAPFGFSFGPESGTAPEVEADEVEENATDEGEEPEAPVKETEDPS